MRYSVAGGMPFSHPRPVPRKTSFLDGYYKNGQPVQQANMGDTLTFDVPGAKSPVFLVQTVNGTPGYRGSFPIPMAPYTMTPGRDAAGQYNNTVYDKDPAAGGVVIETDGIYIGPVTGTPTSTSSTAAICTDPSGNVVQCGPTNAPCGLDPSTGQPIPWSIGGSVPGQPNKTICPVAKPVVKTPTTPPTTTPSGPPTSTTSTTSTTTTTTSTGGGTPGGGTPGGTPATDNSMLILAAAAVAMFLVWRG